MTGIPPAPRGVPKIEVSFDVDANSVLSVTAKDTSNGIEKSITIDNHTNNLKAEDIEKLI